MKEERLEMSQKERDRLHIIRQLKGKIIKTKRQQQPYLGLSVRQTTQDIKRPIGEEAIVP